MLHVGVLIPAICLPLAIHKSILIHPLDGTRAVGHELVCRRRSTDADFTSLEAMERKRDRPTRTLPLVLSGYVIGQQGGGAAYNAKGDLQKIRLPNRNTDAARYVISDSGRESGP